MACEDGVDFTATFQESFSIVSTIDLNANEVKDRINTLLNKHTVNSITYDVTEVHEQSFGRIQMLTILEFFKDKVFKA